jgi:UPF0271 protein
MIDLNADLGEGMDDAAILPFVTSANIACGLHAGGPGVMDRTVALALQHNVRIGAHPGYPDRENFGRTEMQLSPPELRALVLYQLGALDALVKARGGTIHHVKAHGALYNRAAKDSGLARIIAESVRNFRVDLILVGLAGSAQIKAALDAGLAVEGEAFADRRYLPDGTLMPRSQPGAVLHDPAEAAAQALQIVNEHAVTAADGTLIPIDAQTLCMHGDTPGAVAIARAVTRALRGDAA